MPRSITAPAALRIAALALAGPAAGPAFGVPVDPVPSVTPAPPSAQAPPPSFPMMRVVPKGEARTIAFFASLFPACFSQGPVVIRTLDPPRHGSLDIAQADSFPRYVMGSPLAACNTRKVLGLKLTYTSEEGFEGIDTFRIFIINADGSGFESDVRVSVR